MNPDLDRVYRDAEYRVHLTDDTLCLRIGTFDADTDSALRLHAGVTREWSIVTPFNPQSVRLCEHENASRLEDFHRQLALTGCRWFPSSNHDSSSDWPDEPGAFIVDLPLQRAKELGQLFVQNAIVHGMLGQAPQLHWLEKAAVSPTV